MFAFGLLEEEAFCQQSRRKRVVNWELLDGKG